MVLSTATRSAISLTWVVGSVTWSAISPGFSRRPRRKRIVRRKEQVEACDFFCKLNRGALDNQANASHDFQGLGRRGVCGEADKGINDIVVALGQFAAAWPRRLAVERDVGVFRRLERLEAMFLQRRAKLDGCYEVIGTENGGAEMHGEVLWV